MTESVPQVMFMGNYAHKLDPKSRVAIPANWRVVYGQELVMLASTYHDYNIIKCYTQESFATKLNEIRTRALADGFDMGEVDEYIGVIAGNSFAAEVNAQGKLLIPKAQRDRLQLKDTTQLVGRTSHFELWLPEDFAADNSPKLRKDSLLDKKFRML